MTTCRSEVRATGVVVDGVLTLDDRAGFREALREVVGAVEVLVRVRGTTRTADQNRYYWGVVIPTLAEHCGYTREDMHEAVKAVCLSHRTDEGVLVVGSTGTLSVEAFGAYLERVCAWAWTELQVAIPPASTMASSPSPSRCADAAPPSR